MHKEITIFNETILPGKSKTINMQIGKLHTMTDLHIPIIVERSKKEGPVVLLTAGLHGDEINGTEIVRELIVKKINKPKRGTIICIPVINIFGFVNQTREFPDGRDLNRIFPGSKSGSLASQFAYYILNGRNVHRCLYISRKDNNRLWYDSEHLECIIKRMKTRLGGLSK